MYLLFFIGLCIVGLYAIGEFVNIFTPADEKESLNQSYQFANDIENFFDQEDRAQAEVERLKLEGELAAQQIELAKVKAEVLHFKVLHRKETDVDSEVSAAVWSSFEEQ